MAYNGEGKGRAWRVILVFSQQVLGKEIQEDEDQERVYDLHGLMAGLGNFRPL